MKKIWSYIVETRAGILSTTVLPVILGTTLASYCGHQINIILLWSLLGGFVFTHLGTNIVNDYFDAGDGTDGINTGFIGPFTGGSRMLQSGALSMKEVLSEGIVFFVLAAACFISASLKSNPVVLVAGVLGIASGIFYSAPPLKISRTGFGETLVFFVFGPLITFTAYYAQTMEPGLKLNLEPVIISIPLGLLTAAFVIIAELPDRLADMETGKNNLAVKFGPEKTVFLYAAVSAAAYLCIPAGIAMGIMPAGGLLAISGAVVSAAAFFELRRKYKTPGKLGLACALTLVAHLITGLLLIVSFRAWSL